MTDKLVKVIYSDDGYDVFTLEGEEVQLGEMRQVVDEVTGELAKEGFEASAAALKEPREEGLGDFIREISGAKDHMIFNLCEGAFDNSANEMNVAALLELYGLKFTGSDSLTLGLAVDKALTKSVLEGNGIPTPGYFVVDELPLALGQDRRFPLIVKPLREDASIGIEAESVVTTPEELEKRVDYVLSNYAQPAIVEEYIDGREFNISVLGNGKDAKALPPSEIDYSGFPVDKPRICCYEAKWVTASPLYQKTPPVCPALIPPELKKRLQSLALKTYKVLGCRDYGRVDMRIGSDGSVKVLEVNPNPDISSDAGLARAADAVGLSYSQLLAKIIRTAETRYLAEEEV